VAHPVVAAGLCTIAKPPVVTVIILLAFDATQTLVAGRALGQTRTFRWGIGTGLVSATGISGAGHIVVTFFVRCAADATNIGIARQPLGAALRIDRGLTGPTGAGIDGTGYPVVALGIGRTFRTAIGGVAGTRFALVVVRGEQAGPVDALIPRAGYPVVAQLVLRHVDARAVDAFVPGAVRTVITAVCTDNFDIRIA
jgi:hypothetical protein